MKNNPSEGTNPACLQNAKEAAVTLYGIIRAAGTANLEIHSEIDPVASELVRYAVDGLLEAAAILAKNHADSLDRLDLPGVEQ